MAIRKFFIAITVSLLVFAMSAAPVYAVSLLPQAGDCTQYQDKIKDAEHPDSNAMVPNSSTPQRGALRTREAFDAFVGGDNAKLEEALGCAMKLGKIRLFMIPFFIMFIVKTLLGVAGILAVLFVVYGGFQYVVGGISEAKDEGKKTIQHALIGLLIALSAWLIVNFVQVTLTS